MTPSWFLYFSENHITCSKVGSTLNGIDICYDWPLQWCGLLSSSVTKARVLALANHCLPRQRELMTFGFY